MAYTNNANNALKKSFCKVCFDAGKPELEYTNHCVKNNTGKLICPILLNQLCRYCSKNGHTVSYCPVMAKNKKRESYLEKDKKDVKKKDVKKIIKNKFQVLDSDSEEEVEEVEEVEEEVIYEKKITYASVCAAVKACATDKAYETVKACATVSSGIKPILVNGKRAWADYSSDEDDE
jgi:hypothetical protein